jgi:hypothetical protein
MSLNVAALADFNNQIAGELVLKMVYGGSTIEYVTVQEGVKFQEPINLFEVSLYMNNSACVSSASGSATFTQRTIEVCPRTSFDALCLKDLDTKYLGISSLDRGSYNETWALANAYSELLVNQFQKANKFPCLLHNETFSQSSLLDINIVKYSGVINPFFPTIMSKAVFFSFYLLFFI